MDRRNFFKTCAIASSAGLMASCVSGNAVVSEGETDEKTTNAYLARAVTTRGGAFAEGERIYASYLGASCPYSIAEVLADVERSRRAGQGNIFRVNSIITIVPSTDSDMPFVHELSRYDGDSLLSIYLGCVASFRNASLRGEAIDVSASKVTEVAQRLGFRPRLRANLDRSRIMNTALIRSLAEVGISRTPYIGVENG